MAMNRKAEIIDLSELEAKPVCSLNDLYTAEAFNLPERKIEDKATRDEKCVILGDGYAIPEKIYFDLYGALPVWGYQETPEEKSKHEEKKSIATAINPEKYKEQFTKLLDNLITWGTQNKVLTTALANLNNLKQSIFLSEYSKHQTAHYFIAYKQALEKIWYIITQKDNIPLTTKVKKLKSLNQGVGVCDSGSYTNVMDIADELIVDRSIEAVLSKLRRNIADTYSAKYSAKNHIFEGNQIHICNALYGYQAGEGWGPIVDISKIKERYDDKFTFINDDILVNFHEFFERSYTPNVILYCIITHCLSEMLSELNLIAAEELKNDAEGWVPYTQALMNAASKVAKYVGGEWSIFLEYDDKKNLLRFNPHLFSENFLKFCEENNKFFKAKLWEKRNLSGELKEYKIHTYNYSFRNLLWIEAPDGKALNWSELDKLITSNRELGLLLDSFYDSGIPSSILGSFNFKNRLATLDGVIDLVKGIGDKLIIIKFIFFTYPQLDFLFNLAEHETLDKLNELIKLCPQFLDYAKDLMKVKNAESETFLSLAAKKNNIAIVKHFLLAEEKSSIASVMQQHFVHETTLLLQIITYLVQHSQFDLINEITARFQHLARIPGLLETILASDKPCPKDLASTLTKYKPDDKVILELFNLALKNKHYNIAEEFLNRENYLYAIERVCIHSFSTPAILGSIAKFTNELIATGNYSFALKILSKFTGAVASKLDPNLLLNLVKSSDELAYTIITFFKNYFTGNLTTTDENGNSILQIALQHKNYYALSLLLDDKCTRLFTFTAEQLLQIKNQLPSIPETEEIPRKAILHDIHLRLLNLSHLDGVIETITDGIDTSRISNLVLSDIMTFAIQQQKFDTVLYLITRETKRLTPFIQSLTAQLLITNEEKSISSQNKNSVLGQILIFTMQNGNWDAALALLRAAPNLDKAQVSFKEKESALHLLAKCNNSALIHELIMDNKHLAPQTSYNKTFLECAILHFNKEILSLFTKQPELFSQFSDAQMGNIFWTALPDSFRSFKNSDDDKVKWRFAEMIISLRPGCLNAMSYSRYKIKDMMTIANLPPNWLMLTILNVDHYDKEVRYDENIFKAAIQVKRTDLISEFIQNPLILDKYDDIHIGDALLQLIISGYYDFALEVLSKRPSVSLSSFDEKLNSAFDILLFNEKPHVKLLNKICFNSSLYVLKETLTKKISSESVNYKKIILSRINTIFNLLETPADILAFIDKLSRIRKDFSFFNYKSIFGTQLASKWRGELVSYDWLIIIDQAKSQIQQLTENGASLNSSVVDFLNERVRTVKKVAEMKVNAESKQEPQFTMQKKS